MKVVSTDDVRRWFVEANELNGFTQRIGRRHADDEAVDPGFRMPRHLQILIEKLAEERDVVPVDALDSIPFYSLCRGLFLPLSMLTPDRAAATFGLQIEAPPDSKGRDKLLSEFVSKDVGLTLVEKLGCILGDVFLGKRSTVRRDSLIRLLMSVRMISRTECLDRLTQVGDVAILFAESRPELRCDPPLTAAEVVQTLRFIPQLKRTQKFDVLRTLFLRCGRLEAYFLAKLLLQKAGLGYEYQGQVIARLLADEFSVSEEQVSHAMALTDAFHVAETLINEGVDGLKKIQLQPLVPIKPMLAGGMADDIDASEFPVWVERKYDGIRLMLHKSSDARGSVLSGAYTRNRGDWLEQIPGLDASIRGIPAHNAIVDGELYGTVLDIDAGARPATVYEVYGALQGDSSRAVNLKFAAFDLIYLNGMDLTPQTLSQRREMLLALFTPLASQPLPIPLSVSEGQLANGKEDLNRLFHHFRAQGYEGIIAKDLDSPYHLATRDPNWRKRKPEITLDLVILGGTLSVSTKETAGMFGSYVIGARNPDGGFDDVGDVAGVDRVRDAQIQQEIMREGLFTGERYERPSASGARPGYYLRPSIVITIKFEGLTRDSVTGDLRLRDPKIAVIRSDKSAAEADTLNTIEELYLRQRVG